ncbi:MAG: DEAD/DEAH box helicase [Clostridiales bacterium]|nr:DEAD/DEAH box helicase [Clostridiales bacterium]
MEETLTFQDMNLDPRILRAVEEMGFEQPSPIQAKAIPVVMEGVDIIGQAQTGTGKTAAFGIPVLHKIDPKDRHTQAIILCPTRELAIQVADEMRKLCKFMHGIKILPIYGGQEISKQIRSLKGGIQLIIGTPGRVMDHMRRHTLKLEHTKMIVLDEADEMLDMGFREDIETILKEMPEERQTILFSATMPKAIEEIARTYQKDTQIVKVIKKELTVPKIEQYYYEVKPKRKSEVLSRLLDIYDPKLSLVFCNTKRGVDELVEDLKGRGYFAEGLHGDMKQVQRDRVMKHFRDGKTDILVATDVAARGIDVDDVEAVFNYDVPQDDEFYVHRIGRTGRAGREGRAFTFVVGREVYKLRDIQRYCKTKIKLQPIPSIKDVKNTRIEKVLQETRAIIESEEDLSEMINYIEDMVNDEEYTSLDVAAAFLKMAITNEEDSFEDFDLEPHYYGNDRGEKGGRGRRNRKRSLEDLSDTGAEEGMVRLFINSGKKNGTRPGDIVGAIAGETGIPGKLIGSIDMFERFTFVEVPEEYAKDVIKAMSKTKIKGRTVVIEPASQRQNG